jgi:hypothetical protein
MSKPNKDLSKLNNLKDKAPTPQDAAKVLGGKMRRGGDDDLKDLEVER